MVTTQKLTLEEFLALPEDKPYKEFVDGEVIGKVAPQYHHSLLQSQIAARIIASPLAESFDAVTEARFVFGDPRRAYLPDVGVVRRSRLNRGRGGKFDNSLPFAPDIAIEILSPDDRTGDVLEKIRFYLENGVTLTIVVDPDRDRAVIYERGKEARMIAVPGTFDLAPVIPGLELDLGAIFARLQAPDENSQTD